jgi:hypothetical protein
MPSFAPSTAARSQPTRPTLCRSLMADIIAALWPERCKALVSVSGYLIGSPEAGKVPLPPKAELHGGLNMILPQNAAAPATRNTGTILRSYLGRSPHRNGISMMRPSIAPLRPSTTQITSES